MIPRTEAERITEAILSRSTAGEGEVIVSAARGNSLRLAENGPSEQNSRVSTEVSLRVALGKRQGRATCASLSDSAFDTLVDSAVAAARVAPEVDLPELAGPSEDPDGGHEERAAHSLAEHAPETKVDEVGGYLTRVRDAGGAATGFYETQGCSLTYATSRGCFRHAFSGSASFSSTVLAGDGAGVAKVLRHGEPLDSAAVGRTGSRALDKALASRSPRSIEPGEYRVLLEPQAVGDLLLFLSWAGLGARAFLDGRSFLSNKIGERVLSEKITLRDDASHPRFAARLFDLEGMSRERVTLVEAGVARGPVFDRPTAKEAGKTTTGHAGLQPSASGPQTSCLVLEPSQPASATDDDLCARLGDGLLVTQLHYTNLQDPLPVTVTGMTRNGTFLVENGRIAHAVKNLRFTQSLVEAFGAVDAVGSELSLVEAFFGGASLAPPVVLPSFRFTSTTEF